MLTLKNVSMKYKRSDQEVLKNINLTLPDKGLVFVIGASGSGKSTLLNLIAGFIKPTHGNIYYNYKDITKFNSKKTNDYISSNISFIHQNYNLINYLTVDDNIKLRNKNYDEKILTELRINKLKNKKVKDLSGGEKQRVAIARALASYSDLILADEPTGALDSYNSKKIINVLKKISRKHLVIIVTHNNDLIKYGDQVITIEDGKIKSNVQKSKVINNQTFNSKLKELKRNVISLIIKNLYNKLKRNLLTILAFSIGLITLLLVLSISKGFSLSLDESEKSTLASYPITISENSYNIDNSFKEIFSNSSSLDKISVSPSEHKNTIDEAFIKHIKSLEVLSKRIEYTYYVDDFILTNISNIDSFYNDIDLIKGEKIDKENDLILLIDANNMISSNLASMLQLEKESYDFEELIGIEFRIKSKFYKIVGIAKGNNNSFYADVSGLYCFNNISSIPLSISIMPKDYNSKQSIINSLELYGDIEFTDYAASIKKISVNLIDAITIVLIVFSLISLVITSFMIGIITYISVLERVKDIGILKSLGFTNQEVKRVFYLENIIIAIISFIFSVITLIVISIPLNRLLYNLTGFEHILIIDLGNLLYIFILSIVISLIGSFIPINRIKRLDILTALNYE